MKSKDYIILGGAIAIYLLWKNSKTKKTTASGGVAGGTGTSQGTTMPTSNEPEQIFGASLPSGMDLPVLTAGTGVATEVALQEGLGNTTPTPAIVPPKTLATIQALEISDIKPIVKPFQQSEAPQGTPITPRQEPNIVSAEL